MYKLSLNGNMSLWAAEQDADDLQMKTHLEKDPGPGLAELEPSEVVVARSNLRPTEPTEIHCEPLLARRRLVLPTRESAPRLRRRPKLRPGWP